MRLFAGLLAVFVLAPLGLRAAEAIAVVSGEHETYARLAFSVSPDRVWNLETNATVAELQFPSQDLDFDVSAVFDRIPKTRLAAIRSFSRQNTTIVSMVLACDCSVRAFAYLDEYIVVDIVDTENPETTSGSTRHSAPELHVADRNSSAGRPPSQVSWKTPSAPRYIPSVQTVNFPSESGLQAIHQTDQLPSNLETDQSVHVTTPEKSPSQENLQEAVDAARESLLKQLTFAADYGLVDLTEPLPKPPPANEPAQPKILEETAAAIAPTVESENQLVIQSVYERDASLAGQSEKQSGSDCLTEEALDIASWGSGTNFSEEISAFREAMLMEFDEPNYLAVEDLVKTYLRYGFGAEARSYLIEYGENISNSPLLLDISAVVDGYPLSGAGPLSAVVGCGGIAGIWAIVGEYPDVESQTGSVESIVTSFAELPPDIRKLLGPRLVAALIGRNLDDTARLVADILERAPGEHGEAHDLAVGRLMQIEDDEPSATDVFETLSTGSSETSVEALLQLASLSLTHETSPPENLLTDLGAAAKIWQGTEKGALLKRQEALWMAKHGQGGNAIDLLLDAIELDPNEASLFRQTAEEILADLSESGEIFSAFPETVYSYLDYIPGDPEADGLRLKIAQQLLRGALPDFAIEILQSPYQRGNVDAILLTARAHISALRPDDALKSLADLSGRRPRPLRVEAFLRTGNFEAALSELSNSEGFEVQPHWFAGDWALAAKTDPAAAKISERIFPTHMSAPPEAAPLTLSSAMEMLDTSRQESSALREIVKLP